MRLKLKIGLLFLSIIILSLPTRAQEFIPVVCAGSEATYYVPNTEGSTYFWEIEGASPSNYEIIGNGNDSITVKWGFLAESFTLKVTETTTNGCEGEFEVTGIINTPFVSLGPDLIYCVGEPMELNPDYNAEAAAAFEWYSQSTGSDVIISSSPIFTLDPAREDEFVFKYYENVPYNGLYNGDPGLLVCTNSDTVITYVRDYPNVNLPGDTVLCGSQELELDALDGINTDIFDNLFVNWYVDDLDNQVESGQYYYAEGGEKDVIAEVQQVWNIENAITAYCTSYDTLHVERCSAEDLFVARAFMPDAAQHSENATWTIRNSENAELNMVLEVYNRWGARVYYFEGAYNNDWDGKTNSGQPLPMDSYFYIIKIQVDSDEWVTKQGTVTIVR